MRSQHFQRGIGVLFRRHAWAVSVRLVLLGPVLLTGCTGDPGPSQTGNGPLSQGLSSSEDLARDQDPVDDTTMALVSIATRSVSLVQSVHDGEDGLDPLRSEFEALSVAVRSLGGPLPYGEALAESFDRFSEALTPGELRRSALDDAEVDWRDAVIAIERLTGLPILPRGSAPKSQGAETVGPDFADPLGAEGPGPLRAPPPPANLTTTPPSIPGPPDSATPTTFPAPRPTTTFPPPA